MNTAQQAVRSILNKISLGHILVAVALVGLAYGVVRVHNSETETATVTFISCGSTDSPADKYTGPGVFVGDRFVKDTNGNGCQDPGEPGVSGIDAILTGPDGKPVKNLDGQIVGPQTTDATGKYRFIDLPKLAAGHYVVTLISFPQGSYLSAY